MKYCWPSHLILVGLVVAMGCGKPSEAPVAEVGPHQISASALRNFVEKLLPGQRTSKKGDAARRHYLQVLIDGRLLLIEARDRGLDTTRSVVRAVLQAVDGQVRTLYYNSKISSQDSLEEAEMQRYFEEEGFARERRCSGIIVDSRERIEEVLVELRVGRSFKEVARVYSLDKRSAEQGGDLGFVGRSRIDQLHIPPDLFRSLPQGEISAPLPAGDGAWHLIRFTDERPASFATYRPFIQAQLRDEKKIQAEREHLEMLRASFQVQLNAAGLREIVEAHRRKDAADLASSSTPLYAHDKGKIRVSEAYEALRVRNLRRAFTDSAEAVSMLDKGVLRSFLLKRAALEAGLYDALEIRRLRKRKEEDVLLEKLKEVAVTRHIDLPEAEIRHYYESHPRTFRTEGTTYVEEVLLPTGEEARQAKEQLQSGALFADLAESSVRKDAVKNEARFHFHALTKVVYPKLLTALESAPAGEIVGPVEVEHGFSVFRVLEREPEGVLPYEQAREQSRNLLLLNREAQELEKLVKNLREKYSARIRVNDEHLTRALPDSLVQG